MMAFKYLKRSVYLLLFVFAGCEYEPAPTSVQQSELPVGIDLNRMYVFGDTFASGFMDGALYQTGQQNSFTSILINELVQSNDLAPFSQYLIQSETGLNQEFTNSTNGKFEIYYPTTDYIYPFRSAVEGEQIAASLNENVRDFSLVGAKSYELDDAALLNGNPYYDAFYSNSETPFSRLLASDPDVVVMFLGMEDLFDFASNGANGSFDNDLASITPNDLITSTDFDAVIGNYVSTILSQTDSEIIISTLFDPLESPYFKTISRAIEPEIYPASYVGAMGVHYAELINNIAEYHIENGIPLYQARVTLDFDTENWPNTSEFFRSRVLVDEDTPVLFLADGTEIPNYRRMYSEELIPYKFIEDLNPGSSLGGTEPLTDEQALILSELFRIRIALTNFNDSIRAIAAANSRVKLLDVEDVIFRVVNGNYRVDNIQYGANFDRNTIFSADGYSLNARGNAVITRELQMLLNEEYGSNLTLVNPNEYKGLNYRLE